jgi:hypothetical protein
MIYRFLDNISCVEMDYIIFFKQNELEIDVMAKVRPTVMHSEINIFNIIDGEIKWRNVNNQMISVACQEYCNKIQKLRAFA